VKKLIIFDALATIAHEARTMPSTAFVTAIVFAGLSSGPSTATDDDVVLHVTNITVHIVRHGGAGSRIEAKINNPNDFAVYDVIAACDFKDRQNAVLSSSSVTFPDAVLGNATRTLRNFPSEQWPQQAKTAYCTSEQAKRLPE